MDSPQTKNEQEALPPNPPIYQGVGDQPNQVRPKSRRRNLRIKPILTTIFILGLLTAMVAAGVHFWQNSDLTEQARNYRKPANGTKSGINGASWLESPKDLGDLKLFSGSFNNESHFHYFQVGMTKQGQEIILAGASLLSSATQPESLFTDIGYIVKASDDKYLLIKGALSDAYRQQKEHNKDTLIFDPKIKLDDTFEVPELVLANKVEHPTSSDTLTKTEKAVYTDFKYPQNIKEALPTLVAETKEGYLYKDSSAEDSYILYRYDFRVVGYRK